MPKIHEVASITSKGQITLPKSIRRALGVDYGGKVAFDLLGSKVVVTRVQESSHQDPAIGNFLQLLEVDIRTGKQLMTLSENLSQAMLATLHQAIDLDADIDGDVAL